MPDEKSEKSEKSPEEYRIERVFPIRIQPQGRKAPTTPEQTALKLADEQSTDDGMPEDPSETSIDGQPSIFDAPKVSTSQLLESTSPAGGRFITSRFSYHGDEGGPSSSTSAPDQKVYKCEDEPIHIPGAVQRFGALIAIRENADHRFLVRVVSENAQSVTGLEPEALFDLRCFTDLLIQSDKKEFWTRVRGIRNQKYTSRTNPDVFPLSLTSLLGAPLPVYCAMHWIPESNLVICEFELKKDVFNPTHPPDDGLPEKPIHIIDNEAPEKERLLSTTSKSQPLHAVQVARETSRQIGSMELFHVLCEIQNQLASATTLESLLDIVVGLVYELTSFHRVMVYQFDETAAGCVISEIVDPRASTDIYRGLHFPASDIPKQARELYMINKIRVLYDRDQSTARLMCRTKEDASVPLDLKHSYLRAMSPIHIKYLQNMGVRASMSISLTVDNKLWGLISCHSYASGMRVSLPVRELCRALGDLASTNIEKLLYSSRIKARKPLSTAPPKNSPSAYIAASSEDLLNMFGADFGFLAIKGEARTIGKLSAYNEAIFLLQYVRERNFTSIFSSKCIKLDLKGLEYPGGFKVIAGILVIPLALSGSDFLIFFRRGQQLEVQWAGNPFQAKKQAGNYLQPRASFKRWTEHVGDRSREWTEDQVESAAVLSTLYGRFIEVWRQKEAIVQKNRMTRLLIRNAGHEVRTPLNSIINYLEVALEEVLDERARQHLQRSLQASKSLVFQVNDLLNLTEAEDSDLRVNEDNVDLKLMITEVMNSFKEGSFRERLDIQLGSDREVATIVRCDPSMLRQVISNLLANAIEHSKGGNVRIQLAHQQTTPTDTLVEMSFQDNGRGMSEAELDVLFQDFEQVLDDEENQATGLYEDNGQSSPPSDASGPITLGLGLAITARFVRLNYGQISIGSERGKGTKVSITIPFRKGFTAQDAQSETSLPTPPLLTPDATPRLTNPLASPKGVLERSVSADTILPIRHPLGAQRRDDVPVTFAQESLNAAVNAEMLINVPTFDPSTGRFPFPKPGGAYNRANVLIAEDNPLNSRLLETRLVRRGHSVKVAVDGQICAEIFEKNSDAFDIILMDLQMPLVDGVGATRMIRHFEKTYSPPLSSNIKSYGRIPIIAVSASLSELARSDYVNSGFDGWILKPIDFTRLECIIAAIQDEERRRILLYGNTSWEKGGWFKLRPEEGGKGLGLGGEGFNGDEDFAGGVKGGGKVGSC